VDEAIVEYDDIVVGEIDGARRFKSSTQQAIFDVRDLKLDETAHLGAYSRRGRTPILAEPTTLPFTTGHAMLTFREGR
jgi:hypothetical protein